MFMKYLIILNKCIFCCLEQRLFSFIFEGEKIYFKCVLQDLFIYFNIKCYVFSLKFDVMLCYVFKNMVFGNGVIRFVIVIFCYFR